MSQMDLLHKDGTPGSAESMAQILRRAPIETGDFVMLPRIASESSIPVILEKVGVTGHIVAADPKPENIASAREKYGRKHNVDFLCADASMLRPMDGLYHDIVLCEDGRCLDPWARIVRMACMLLPSGRMIYIQQNERGYGPQQIIDLMQAAGLHASVAAQTEALYMVVGIESLD